MNAATNTTEFITLSKLIQSKTNDLYNELGAFYAFGNKQFEEKKKEGIDYVNLQSGLICPKQNAKELLSRFEVIFDEAIKAQVSLFGAIRIIHYEYFNYETQLTRDVDNLIDVLSCYSEMFPELFTEEIIRKEAKICWNIAVENDCF